MWVFSCSAGSQLLPITSHAAAILHTQAQADVTSYFHYSNQPVKTNMESPILQALKTESALPSIIIFFPVLWRSLAIISNVSM